MAELRELHAIGYPIVGRSEQPHRCHLIVGVHFALGLIAIEREIERAGTDLSVNDRIQSDLRRIDDLGCTGTII